MAELTPAQLFASIFRCNPVQLRNFRTNLDGNYVAIIPSGQKHVLTPAQLEHERARLQAALSGAAESIAGKKKTPRRPEKTTRGVR